MVTLSRSLFSPKLNNCNEKMKAFMFMCIIIEINNVVILV